MKAGAKAMFAIATFLGLMSIIYALATVYVADDGYLNLGIEWAGLTGMVLAFLLATMLGAYLYFADSRSDLTPDDWEEAEIADQEGVVGFFSPSSIWPLAMSGAIAVLGFGIIFMYYWMIILGAVLLIWSTTMLNVQYGMPKEKH